MPLRFNKVVSPKATPTDMMYGEVLEIEKNVRRELGAISSLPLVAGGGLLKNVLVVEQLSGVGLVSRHRT